MKLSHQVTLTLAILFLCVGYQQFGFGQSNEIGFESQTAGLFAEMDTELGTWNNVSGKVLIDSAHAKTGDQCLQLAGGAEGSSVELIIDEDVKTDGQLVFWAERWTVREPFSFRIDKWSDESWMEIYNGDEAVRVGRAFLSQVRVPLGDEGISKLRFRVISPEDTGVLIDDLRIAPATQQKITSVTAVPTTLPALVGNEASAIVKLKVTTTGTLDPISVTSISASLVGEDSHICIKQVQPFFTGSNSKFAWDRPFSNARTPRQGDPQQFEGEQLLAEGDNFFWIACQLKSLANVDIDKTVAAQIDSITFSNGETKEIGGRPSIQRLGIALRNSGDDGVHTYRIPGLATTNKGTLIGVYDIRRDGGRDLPGNIDVGMSRSTDGGKTWEAMKVIQDMGDDPNWNGDGIGDPSVLVDRKTGTIWVSGTWSHGNRSWRGSGPGLKPEETGQWILVKSEDDGVTWSDPINITEQVKDPSWCFILQGPGKGFTMSDGTLVFPAQYQDTPENKRLPRSTLIYSRDQGETWKVATGAWDDTTESQIVELGDGELMINCRTNRSTQRAVLVTRDMGQSWTQHETHLNTLIEPRACMASLINVGRELDFLGLENEKINNDFLLFSNPDSLNGRNHITIKASLDGGMTWPSKFHLLLDEQTGAGYSCLSMIDEDTVGILYEGSQSHLTFQRIKISEILNPPKDRKTKNPAFAAFGTGFVPLKKPELVDLRVSPSFARPFSDHMVLQCEQPLRLWGKARPGSTVEVRVGAELTKSATAEDSGCWTVEFPAQNASFGPVKITATNEHGSMELNDVLFGEVWICAGQSNMEWPLKNSEGGKQAIHAAHDSSIRLFNCVASLRGGSGVYPEDQMDQLWPENFSRGTWRVASADSLPDFSAVGYHFGKKLRSNLDRPIGLINVAVGGTPIESWVSRERLKRSRLSSILDSNWLENRLTNGWCKERAIFNLQNGLAGKFHIPGDQIGPNHSFKPTFMFEAGIKPFVPLSIRGVLWYQGESNAESTSRIDLYDDCFPLLIADFRTSFRNEKLPIGFVQLPAMERPAWPLFRERQRRSLANYENVGMAITIDTGHRTDVHPRDKRPVGERLATWALADVYEKGGVSMGPLFVSHEILDEKLALQFESTGTGLMTNDEAAPLHFELAGADSIFYPATATIVSDDKIVLTSSAVLNPLHARYAWKPFPDPPVNLFNSDGLPASPFTTEELD